MRRRCALVGYVACLLVAATFGRGAAAEDKLAAGAAKTVYQVGVAKVDVTPAYPVRLNGFGFRRTESEGVNQPIFAKALAIGTDDEKPLVLITLDSLGVRENHVDEVAARLKKRFGIERDRVVVTFSHSHTTPKVTGACDTIFSTPIPPEHQAHIDQYTADLIDAMEQVAAAALADRQPATLSWTVGTVTFAKNRRPQGGPVDHTLPLLVVKSADGSKVRALYTTYACHCVTLSNNLVSGDWAGYAQHAIEQKHPGTIALTSIGCGSDANPDSGVTGDNYAAAASQGAQIADEVERLLATELRPVTGAVRVAATHIDLALNSPPSREQLAAVAEKSDQAGYNAKFQLAKLERGEPLLSGFHYPIVCWEFGDSLAMEFLAGEICNDYAVSLREQLDAGRLWLHGYSNDFCAYIPSERLLREGGYGGGAEAVYFAMPNTFAPGLEPKILAAASKLVSPAFHLPKAVDAKADGAKAAAAAGGDNESPNWSVERSLAAIRVKQGLVVQAVASEPLVADPVAIDFAPDGRLWVAEMPDYSQYPEEKFEQHGNVRLLTDADGDGRYDAMTVFADGLRFPTGVKSWRKGVLVCDAPDVLYLEDTDGDGKADVRRVMLTGFETHNAQARVNSLRWGLDNWLYGACGLFGGAIRTGTGREIALGQRDFRFRPDSGELEPVTGRTQQGRARNDWGDWFGCENGSLADHYPLVDQYLARNPRLVPPSPEHPLPTAEATALRPVGELTLFKLSGPPGRPTSVCGLEVYRDDFLGAEYDGNLFVAEPVNQLVHRLVLSPQGTTFTGKLAADEQQQEFLASSDPWFRPVQVRTGPDGCLYVVDMHRAVIEHQKFIPAETLAQVELLGGQREGRIFRVRPAAKEVRQGVDFLALSTAELVAALDTPNGQRRDTAHELLVQWRDPAAIAPLRQLARESALPATRLQALCVLDGLQGLEADLLAGALGDAHPGVRRHAVRLSESWLASAPALGDKLIALVGDADPQVQMQLAYSLGAWNDPRVPTALATIALANPRDPYMLAAVWSSVSGKNASAVFAALVRQAGVDAIPAAVVEPALRLAVELGDAKELTTVGAALAVGKGGTYKNWQLDVAAKLMVAVRAKSQGEQTLAAQLAPLVTSARAILADGGADDDQLLGALQLVVAASAEDQLPDLFKPLLGPQRSPTFQQSVVELAVRGAGERGVNMVLAAWPGLAAGAREQAFGAIVGHKQYATKLLDQVAAGAIAGGSLDATQRQRLLAHADADVRAAAAKVFTAATNRRHVVEEYLAKADGPGDAAHGKALFAKNCASCHILEGVGHEVGPDLAALTSREKPGLVESILDPNRAVDDRYRSYTALTIDGLAHTGLLAAETATSVTIVDQQAQSHTLLRSDVESLALTGQSLMPEGLERELSPADVNDLTAYLAAVGQPATTTTPTSTAAPAVPPQPNFRTAPAQAIVKLVDGLAVGTPKEYERIPAIWEHAFAAGRRNDSQELAELLELSIPRDGKAPANWQIVVLGGGVVNGLSDVGAWPGRRVVELLKLSQHTPEQWRHVLDCCVAKVDDAKTHIGTRYDALRVLGAAAWSPYVEHALRYATTTTPPDLQNGAVKALADCDAGETIEPLVAAVANLEGEARRFAVQGLLRGPQRVQALQAAVAAKRIAPELLTAEEHAKLQAELPLDESKLR